MGYNDITMAILWCYNVKTYTDTLEPQILMIILPSSETAVDMSTYFTIFKAFVIPIYST